MSRTRAARRLRVSRLSRALMWTFVAVAFVCAFLQITMLAKLSRQSKAISGTQREIIQLRSQVDNLDMAYEQYHNRERITARATQLGMIKPEDSQLRVVYLPNLVEDTSAQSAENIGAEEIMD